MNSEKHKFINNIEKMVENADDFTKETAKEQIETESGRKINAKQNIDIINQLNAFTERNYPHDNPRT